MVALTFINLSFHNRVPVNIKTLRRQMKAEHVEMDDSTEDESEGEEKEVFFTLF